jgi:hypothetical protein
MDHQKIFETCGNSKNILKVWLVAKVGPPKYFGNLVQKNKFETCNLVHSQNNFVYSMSLSS